MGQGLLSLSTVGTYALTEARPVMDLNQMGEKWVNKITLGVP